MNKFKNQLNEFKKFIVYNTAKNLYKKLLNIYYNDYNNITDKEKEEMGEKYDPRNLLIKGFRFIDSKKESKSQSEETIAERVKSRRQKRI